MKQESGHNKNPGGCRQLVLHFLAAAMGLVTHPSALVQGQCSCLSTLASFGINLTATGSLRVSTTSGMLNYPSTYGVGRCAAHDSDQPPICNGLHPPGWCHQHWCYVNSTSCSGADSLISSTYLAHYPRGAEIKLSYSVCNSPDLWSEFRSSFAGTIRFCSVLKEIDGVPCGNTAPSLQVTAMVEAINSLTGGLGFDVLGRNPGNPSYYRTEYMYETFPDGAWETVGRSRAEILFPQCDVIVGQGHGCGATGDDEIQAQALIAHAHQRLYFTQRGPRRVLSDPADPASRLSRYMFSTHIRSDLYAHGVLRQIAQTITPTRTEDSVRLAILNFGHNAFFDGVAEGALQYAVADDSYEIVNVANLARWSSALGPACEPYGAPSGAVGCSPLAKHMDALIQSAPDVVLVSANSDAFKHVLQYLSDMRPKVNKGQVEKDTKMISALFWVGVPWLKNGAPACAGLRSHCAYTVGATQISPEEADMYQDQLLLAAGLPATYRWLRENHTQLAAAFVKNASKAEADTAVIPSIVAQTMQHVFQFRAPANKSFPLRTAGSADYEALRDYIASGTTIARTYYGPISFDAFGNNVGREPSIFQSQSNGEVTTTFPASLAGSRPYVHPVPALSLAPMGVEAYHLDYGPSCDSTPAELPACGASEGGPQCALCGPLAYDELFPIPTMWLALSGTALLLCALATAVLFARNRINKQRRQHQQAKKVLSDLIYELFVIFQEKVLRETKAQESDDTQAKDRAIRLQQTQDQIAIELKKHIDKARNVGCKLEFVENNFNQMTTDRNEARKIFESVYGRQLTEAELTKSLSASHGQVDAQRNWDYMISYTGRDETASTLAADLCASLIAQGKTVWYDVKVNEYKTLNAEFMEHAARTSGCVIAIITPQYFTREMCRRELRAAKGAGTPVQPVLLPADKTRVGEFLHVAHIHGADDLQYLGDDVEWLTLDRSHMFYWRAGVTLLIQRTESLSRRTGTQTTTIQDASTIEPKLNQTEKAMYAASAAVRNTMTELGLDTTEAEKILDACKVSLIKAYSEEPTFVADHKGSEHADPRSLSGKEIHTQTGSSKVCRDYEANCSLSRSERRARSPPARPRPTTPPCRP